MFEYLPRLTIILSVLFCIANNVLCSAWPSSSSPAVPTEREESLLEREGLLPDYLIVGAGGSGIQAALLLQKYNYSYTILEKESQVGSFWLRFPVFGELISVNKKVRNETQQWKYDWHSMLEAPLSMLDVTQDYFPQGSDWQQYMARVVKEADIKVEFGVEISRFTDDGTPCVVLLNGEKRCSRYRVLLGTGMKEKTQPLLEAMGGVPYSKMSREVARQKTVCILGNGNAGYEVAQNVYDIAEQVILYGKQPARLSSITRYTGDVRVKFLQPTENFHGKLLDTVSHFRDGTTIKQGKLFRWLNHTQLQEVEYAKMAAAFLRQFQCEVLVLATGFQSHVPGLNFHDRFPKSGDWYASHNPSVHYIGWLMHERDFRRGAGGFLSGYRYLIRNLVHHIREEDHGIPYPRLTLSKEEVVKHVVDRIQVVHDLVILQDGVILRDAIVPLNDGTEGYEYYEGITLPFHGDIKDREDVIYIYFAWGDGRRSSNVFESVLGYSNTGRLINLFLHPVIEVNALVRDTMEDLGMIWNTKPYMSANERTIRSALENDLSRFRKKKTYAYVPAQQNQTEHTGPPYHFEAAYGTVKIPKKLSKLILNSVRYGHDAEDIAALHEFAKEWFPDLNERTQEPNDSLPLAEDETDPSASLSLAEGTDSSDFLLAEETDQDTSFC